MRGPPIELDPEPDLAPSVSAPGEIRIGDTSTGKPQLVLELGQWQSCL
jgi:hypothetical protein